MPQRMTAAEQNVRNEMQQHQQPNQQEARPKYQPQQETIVRPLLADFKKRVDQSMSTDELKKVVEENQEWLRMMASQEPELDAIQKKLHSNVQEIEDLAKSNKDMKEELLKLIQNYEDKKETYEVLQATNEALEADLKAKSITQKQIVDLLNKKIKEQELKTKDIEKRFCKEQCLDMKDFVKSYMTERKEYHKYQIYKMKVNAA
jgi:hypothetical protein